VGYPLGLLCAKFLPNKALTVPFTSCTFNLNPGPFNIKEHILLYIFSSSSNIPAYAMYNIVAQKYKLGQQLTTGWCLCFVIASSFIGYGFAGLTRRILVRPSSMLWPSNLSVIALLTTLHEKEITFATDTDVNNSEERPLVTRSRFLWVATLLMFVWQWVPSVFAPLLSAVAVVCFVVPAKFSKLRLFGSATQGLGVGAITFDWSIISLWNPITTPLWALINQFIGGIVIISFFLLFPIEQTN
jgi:hypothetical protein